MVLKNKATRLIFLISTVFFTSVNSIAQTWVKSNDSNAFHLQHLFFNDLKLFFSGIDSGFYALTAHRPDSHWEKNNEIKSALLINKIDKDGNISLIKKLNEYVDRPTLKIFNNKYYLFDNTFKVEKKVYYYNCYVYNANWVLEAELKLLELPDQRGFADFAVTKEGDLFFLTDPYFNEHKNPNFTGSYLVKYSSNGELVKKVFFDEYYASSLRIINDSLHFQLHQQRLTSRFNLPIFIIEMSSDNELSYTIFNTKELIQKEKNVRKEIVLADGESVIYIDSTYSLSKNSWTSVFKIALLDKQHQRKWTIEPSDRWIFGTPKPLQNGTFMVEIDKRWDSTCLVIFDKNGNQKSIKSFLMNADTRIIRYSFIDYFEISENEIWIFYRKRYPTRQEEIYFERLLL